MESLLKEITINTMYSMLIVFCRIGTLFMTTPGIGESYVAIRSRLALSFAVSIVMFPAVLKFIPVMPAESSSLFIIIFIEIITGIFYGLIIRILISIMQIAGILISSQSGLGSATFFDPHQGTQSAIVGNFYMAIAITLFFSTNLHYALIQGIFESFQTLPPGKFTLLEDFTAAIIQTIDNSFMIAFKIAAPVVIVTFLILFGAGILSRLMPGMQVFFILSPVQILVSFFIIMMSFSATIMWYMNLVSNMMSNIFLGK